MSAQYTNNVWCFGDSAGIDFNLQPPQSITSGVRGRHGATSISDNLGNLLFYANGRDFILSGQNNSGIIRNKNHQLMLNGDTLIASWYHDMQIIPIPKSDSLFYLFTGGVTNNYGLYYNLIDLKLQNGLGEVVQKNIQLQNFPVFDALTTVKHANGNDWWILFQDYKINTSDSSNSFYIYKIDSSGIGNLVTQNIGSFRRSNGGDLSFNHKGTKLAYVDLNGTIDIFDFNRYTGTISNFINIEPYNPLGIRNLYGSCVFSTNDKILYVTAYGTPKNDSSFIYQFDLTASNITASKTIIYKVGAPVGLFHMEMGPNKKIYVTSMDESPGVFFPFADTVHTTVTDNLSVINSPDSLGSACDFQPFSFYLGGNCTYYGLPNNPDYTLGPLDTLTAVHEIKPSLAANDLKVFYHPLWDIAFINADKLTGRKYTLSLFDITGKLIFREHGNLNSQYFTKDLGMSAFAKGVYIVTLQTEMDLLSKKFIKY
jgi:hypothetical protein